MFHWLKQGQFAVSFEKACALHAVAVKEEAMGWGCFRSGGVTIAGTDYQPPPANALPALLHRMVSEMNSIPDIDDRAIFVFLAMTRCQFFYDVNKRMGRFMMNGVLLDHGYPAINLPAKRQLEFHQLMLEFYRSNDQQPMNAFMRSCLGKQVIAIMREE